MLKLNKSLTLTFSSQHLHT